MATLNSSLPTSGTPKNPPGPRTETGKAVSRLNALKTGIDAQSQILPGEDPAALETLTAEYYDRLQPATPEERFWTDALIRADWQLRRLSRIEPQVFARLMVYCKDEHPLGYAYQNMSEVLARLQRRVDVAERSYQRASKELERLQSRRPTPGPVLARATEVVEIESPSPQIGFVPSTPPAAAQVPPAHPLSPSRPLLPRPGCNSPTGHPLAGLTKEA